MRFVDVIPATGGPVELRPTGRGRAAWLGENPQDDRPPLSECMPNSFQWELCREILSGINLLAVWGGIGCGKSTGLAMAAKLIAETRPGCGGYFVMSAYPQLNRTAVPNLLTMLGDPWDFKKAERKFVHPNGSWIALAYYDVKSTQHEGQNPIEGANAHWAIVDEAQMWATDMIFKHLSDRCRESAKDLNGNVYNPVIIMNGRPSSIDWWPRAVENAVAAAKAAAETNGTECVTHGRVMRVKSYANLARLGMDWVERQRAIRTPSEFRSLLEGELLETPDTILADWRDVDARGKPCAWPEGNLLTDYQYDPSLPATVCVDPGIGFPAAVVIQSVTREHPTLGQIQLHVIVDVITAEHVTTPALLDKIRDRWWPREYEDVAPIDASGRFDLVVVDAHGGDNTNRHSGMTDVELVQQPPPGASDVDFMGGGLGCETIASYDPVLTSVAYGVTKMQRLILSAAGVRRLVVSPELWRREREAPPTERGWNHTVRAYKYGPRGKPKKGGAGDPSGVADAVRLYVTHVVDDRRTYQNVIRLDDLDLTSVPTRLESLPLDER